MTSIPIRRCGRCPSSSRRPRGRATWTLAREALERLAETTQPAGTDFALGIEARCRALLGDGAAADDLYREAIERLRRTRLRPELARAHLLYGEWLRREGRRRRRPRAAAYRTRHVRRDRDGGVRRARPPRADGLLADGAPLEPPGTGSPAPFRAVPKRAHRSHKPAPNPAVKRLNRNQSLNLWYYVSCNCAAGLILLRVARLSAAFRAWSLSSYRP